MDHILQCRTGFGCDQPDTLRHRRQRAFVVSIKQAFGRKLFLQRIKGHLGRTGTKGAHIIAIQLECAVPLIQRCPAIRQHQHAVFRRKAQQTRFISEHHTLDGGVFIFQGKVAVAAFVMARKVGNLAADDEVIQWFALLQHLFSQQVQGGYIDVFGHALISLAARMDTPMALSLANLPGTK